VEATIKWASNKKLHLEIALIRAIQTLSEVSLDNVIDALESLRGTSGAPPVKESKNGPEEKKPVQEPNQEKAVPAKQVASVGQAVDTGEKASPEVTPFPAASTIPGSKEPQESAWAEILATIRARRPLIVSWLERATALYPEPGTLKLAFPTEQSIAVESLSRPNNRKILEEVANEILGGHWKLEFELRDDLFAGQDKFETATSVDPMELFKNDPKIQKALELFKAEIQSEP